jgi:hypothetical protein
VNVSFNRMSAVVVGVALAVMAATTSASAVPEQNGAQQSAQPGPVSSRNQECLREVTRGAPDSVPTAQQISFAKSVAATTPTVARLAAVRGQSAQQLLNAATTTLVRNAGKTAVQVGFPEGDTGRVASGSVVVELGSGAVIVQKSMVATATDQEIRAGRGEVDITTNGAVTVVSGATIAQDLTKFEHAGHGDTTAQPMDGIDDFQSCLAAAGFVIGWIALVAAVVGCGTVCAAILAGGVTSAAAPWVCAGCITVATGIPLFVIAECIKHFWN